MVKWCVLFEVRTESLNIIQTRLGFKGLNRWHIDTKQNSLYEVSSIGVISAHATEFYYQQEHIYSILSVKYTVTNVSEELIVSIFRAAQTHINQITPP
jgi:hypothetical protein